jgi:hypothetical protein
VHISHLITDFDSHFHDLEGATSLHSSMCHSSFSLYTVLENVTQNSCCMKTVSPISGDTKLQFQIF